MARVYAVHEAKAKLSEILRRVKQGRSVVISERGRPIARVVPIDRSGDVEARLGEMERDGEILAARRGVDAIRPIARRPGALGRFLKSRD
jgi:prevent-host-death family protein